MNAIREQLTRFTQDHGAKLAFVKRLSWLLGYIVVALLIASAGEDEDEDEGADQGGGRRARRRAARQAAREATGNDFDFGDVLVGFIPLVIIIFLAVEAGRLLVGQWRRRQH